MRNKFDLPTYQIKDNIDILMITKRKLNESFPVGQCLISPFHLDCHRNGDGILLYVSEIIPSKPLATESIIEAFFVEINLRKKKWLISCSYNPNKALMANHMAVLNKNIDIYITMYDSLLFLSNFNAGLAG